MQNKKIAVLTSGLSRGSNFQALADFIINKPITIEFVLHTRKKAPIAERCNNLGIEAFYLKTKNNPDFEKNLIEKINNSNLSIVVLAGYMRKLSPEFINAINCPIVNIHPALLPKFGGKGMFGMNVHNAVFEAGETISGATVHYVNSEYDAGDIIAQQSIDIANCTSAEEISKKVLKVEHNLYAKTIVKLLTK